MASLARQGSLCEIDTVSGSPALAEIIGFADGRNKLILLDQDGKICDGATVRLVDSGHHITVGEALLGRVTDALGKPLDGPEIIGLTETWPLAGKPLNPLQRKNVSAPLDVGVKAINGLMTIGLGQRMGIVAGSGVGKSVLLAMMSRYTNADIVVIGLIGERSREVGGFVDSVLDETSRQRTTMVAVPADRSPLLRIRAAARATAIAEYFRDKGKNVLLIMDSLTRVAHAQREIGLALGEQPTSKGYPPSVVSLLPRLIERGGNGINDTGSITAFYTVLADADDGNDPVVDTARAILDGHIVLSRNQAQMGIYPAIDVTLSVSRVMNEITNADHQQMARAFKRLVALYTENRDLILMGGYRQGRDADLDRAVQLWPALMGYIQQLETEKADLATSIEGLSALMPK
ncbi:MAG: FliI/YscN family ATPase [Alphaproteobacteria bacterium]|nr:FliI/YscN family ATPase [Alphaproteobacteria bacterium]